MRRLRHVAPAGAPIRFVDLARLAGLTLSGRDVYQEMRQAICERFGVRHSFLTSTGRAGLTMLLRAMRRLAPARRNEVVLPAYTCFSVAASVMKAGLEPRIVDIDPDTLDYAPGALDAVDFSRVLAIIATNLYGLPNDLPRLAEVAHKAGVFLIDDAAQAMGASVGDRLSGTWGDAGIFSFDKGKNVSAIDGGVVVTNSPDLAAAIANELASLELPGLSDSGVGFVKALIYAVFLRPSLYWIPNSIPQLELGTTVFTTDFPLMQPSRSLVALGVTMLDRLPAFTGARTTNAAMLLSRLQSVPGIRPIRPIADSKPVYLRLPILVEDESARRRLIDRLNAAGVGATASYPTSLADIPQLRPAGAEASACAGGRYVARHVVTLPTHAFVTSEDVERTAAAMRGNAAPALNTSPSHRMIGSNIDITP